MKTLATAPPLLFDRPALERANETWGCNCGPAALAAVLGMTLEEIRPHLGYFAVKRHMNTGDVQAALHSAGCDTGSVSRSMPATRLGMIRIQWGGPWLKPGVPPAAAARYTHWIGFRIHDVQRWIYDVNASWLTLEHWEQNLVPQLVETIRRGDGTWFVANSVEILKRAER